TGLVAIEVGSERKEYTVHKDLLTHYSEYFARALDGPWKEAEDKKVRLEDIEPETFDIFSIANPNDIRIELLKPLAFNGSAQSLPEEDYDFICIQLLNALAFGDRFHVASFKVALVHILVSLIIEFLPPTFRIIIHAFDVLSDSSPVLDLLVNAHCACWCEKTAMESDFEMLPELPIEFIRRVFKRQGARNLEQKGAGKFKHCDYHQHATEDERLQCNWKNQTGEPL
ncbi:hypothetical protein BU23DRAFT_473785, partial [Bimuria novae-zelandiae CBS 107.79]